MAGCCLANRGLPTNPLTAPAPAVGTAGLACRLPVLRAALIIYPLLVMAMLTVAQCEQVTPAAGQLPPPLPLCTHTKHRDREHHCNGGGGAVACPSRL